MITVAFTHKLSIGHLVRIQGHLDLLPQSLLNWIQLDIALLELGLFFDPIRRVLTFNEGLELAREVIHLVDIAGLLQI